MTGDTITTTIMTGGTTTIMDEFLPAAIFQGEQLVLLGGLMLAAAVLLHRSWVLGRRVRQRDPLAEARRGVQDIEQTQSGVDRIEVRLHNYQREVDARVETALSQLRQHVDAARREGDRLETLLKESRRQTDGERSDPDPHSTDPSRAA